MDNNIREREYRKPGFSSGFEAGVDVSKVAGCHLNPIKPKNWGFWFPVISFTTTGLLVLGFVGRVSLGALGGVFGQQVNAKAPVEMQIGNAVGVAFNRSAPVVFQTVGYMGSQATRATLVSNNWAGSNQTQFVNVRPITFQQPALVRWEGQK